MRKSAENSEAGISKPYTRSERFFEKALRCFLVYSRRKGPRQMQISILFEILHLAVETADRMSLENRPVSSAFRGGRGCGDGDLERFAGKS